MAERVPGCNHQNEDGTCVHAIAAVQSKYRRKVSPHARLEPNPPLASSIGIPVQCNSCELLLVATNNCESIRPYANQPLLGKSWLDSTDPSL